ncbi:hypothetical protein [Methylobacterium sp. J-070]|uniref:hypothetical protein n=1 Tax=Methylobacterium sp. J-070 TaxID=2836650 RepID=UPI001FBBDDFF|nr:hypothetical protein [Methylobacterium sp. J-070]MCJ2048262.1 hypothetical protein [Methylobacterium sp. J-070]
MTGTIIPLRSMDDDALALTDLDLSAAELLTQGRAVSLSAARIEVLLAKLHVQRAELAELLADLQARPPSGDSQLDAINADLSDAASKALTVIKLRIGQAETG